MHYFSSQPGGEVCRKKDAGRTAHFYKRHNFAVVQHPADTAGTRRASTALRSCGVDNTIAGTVGTISSFIFALLLSLLLLLVAVVDDDSSLNKAGGDGSAADEHDEEEVGDTMADTRQVMRFFSRTSGQ